MRNHAIFGVKFASSVLLFAGLIFFAMLSARGQSQTSSQTQPCTPANSTQAAANTSANSTKQAEQQVSTAVKNLGSIFGKKKSEAASAPPPCPSASTNASPSATSANSSAQAAPVGSPAADPALANWTAADPFVPDGGLGGAVPGGGGVTAAGGAAAAPTAPPDFAKLPDIGGYLRVGLTIDQAKGALAKMHPGVKITYGTGSFDTIQPVSPNGNPPLAGLHGQFPNESIFFWYSQPPNRPQVAFSVGRGYQYPAPGIDRAKLVAALRQKYGPETKATRRYTTHEEPGDENITEMYWYYDEQGHFIASDQGSSTIGQPPFNCGTGSSWDPHSDSAWGGLLDAIRLNRLGAPGYCDTLVTLRIAFSGPAPGPVTQTATSLDDRALFRRDGLDAGAAAKAKTQQQQQQQLDQSKQAKPSL
jgi:hypothetical protein